MNICICRLVKHFGTQKKTADALEVKQSSVSGWVNGKHGMSPLVARRTEQVTNGEFKASELCPAVFGDSAAAG